MNQKIGILIIAGVGIYGATKESSAPTADELRANDFSTQAISKQISNQTMDLRNKAMNKESSHTQIESFAAKVKRFEILDDFIIEDLLNETASEIERKSVQYKRLHSKNVNNSYEDKDLINLYRTHDALYEIQLKRLLIKI